MTRMTPSFLPLYVSLREYSSYSGQPARIEAHAAQYAYAPGPRGYIAPGREAGEITGDEGSQRGNLQRVWTIDLCEADDTDV
jgi:hypothetical protein